jgi:DNA-binding MarR family transcriptional regulator
MTSGDLEVWRMLVDTTAELERILGAHLQAVSGLSPADYQVLLALSEAAGRRLRSSDLAARIDWQRSRLSHHLGRMERRGLISRNGCAIDSRGAEISLTDAGASAFRGATVPHMRAIKANFGDALTTEQFEALAEILRALQRHLDDQSGESA